MLQISGMSAKNAGRVVIFGSGETSSSGRTVHEWLFNRLPPPVHVAILETPAGFQPNSSIVAGKIKEFLAVRLQNFRPLIDIIPARRLDGDLSPNDPNLIEPIYQSNYLFIGPGSPSYAARNLNGTLAMRAVTQRHLAGAMVCLASAGAMAFSRYVLPVYEVFKAGHDLHWLPGLDYFGQFGFDLAIIPHWNNAEGGQDLDTSRAFMGVERMSQLQAMLPPSTTMLGIDEHSAVVFDFQERACTMMGKGTATIWHQGQEQVIATGERFSFEALRGSKVKESQLAR